MSQASPALIVIPARLAAVRLPQKPLLPIHGEPMIVHVWRRAVAANCGPVIVACGDAEIAAAIESQGGIAVMTDPNLASGTDRVHAAAETFDPEGRYQFVVNVQGDLPTLNPQVISATLKLLQTSSFDLTTAAAVIHDEEEKQSDAVVKIALSLDPTGAAGQGLYFSRSLIPSGPGPHYHHIGLYAFRRPALQTFVTLSPSPLEQQERLEQLRALQDGMTIGVALVDEAPRGVDTLEDLERVRQILKAA